MRYRTGISTQFKFEETGFKKPKLRKREVGSDDEADEELDCFEEKESESEEADTHFGCTRVGATTARLGGSRLGVGRRG